jgi:hypothetical protein
VFTASPAFAGDREIFKIFPPPFEKQAGRQASPASGFCFAAQVAP